MAAAHLTLAQFRELFADFAGAPDALVEARLAEAARRTPSSVWGDQTSDGHGWLTAHLLAQTSFGQQARLANEDGTSSYGKVREDMEMELGPAVAPRTT